MEKLTIALTLKQIIMMEKVFVVIKIVRWYQHEETNTSGRAWLLPPCDNEIVHAQAHAHKSTCMGVCECVQDKKKKEKKKSLGKSWGYILRIYYRYCLPCTQFTLFSSIAIIKPRPINHPLDLPHLWMMSLW